MLEVFEEVGLPREKFGTQSMRSGGATLAANSGGSRQALDGAQGMEVFRVCGRVCQDLF